MPVPIRESAYQLDAIIGIAEASFGTDEAGDPYTVRRIGGTARSDLGPLLLKWNAIPIENHLRLWLLYQVVTGTSVLTDAAYAPLEGILPTTANLTIRGVEVDILSLAAPVPSGGIRAWFAGLPGVRDLPIIEPDGDALFQNGRVSVGDEPFDLKTFTLALRSGLEVVSGVVAAIDRDVPVAGIGPQKPAVAMVTPTMDGAINLRRGTEKSIWAQLVDSTTTPLDAPDGVEASVVVQEQTVSYVTRERVPVSSVLIVGADLFGISSVEPVDRGRYHQVTASRRYQGVSL